MDGFLLVDKPIGLTSHDVVAHVRKILRQASSKQLIVDSKELTTKHLQLTTRAPKVRVGHTGTLDPLATGLMIIVVGSYTKRAQEFSKMDKTYEAEITLGATSTTGDSEGEITPYPTKKPNKNTRSRIFVAEIDNVLGGFVGEIMQTPHAHSAVKVGGQRAYKLARQGKEFKIEPRKVTVYEIRSTICEYPKLRFTVRVSSGTYIRSLAEDIGQKLGTGAYVSALRRTKVGEFKLKDALRTDSLSVEKMAKNLQKS